MKPFAVVLILGLAPAVDTSASELQTIAISGAPSSAQFFSIADRDHLFAGIAPGDTYYTPVHATSHDRDLALTVRYDQIYAVGANGESIPIAAPNGVDETFKVVVQTNAAKLAFRVDLAGDDRYDDVDLIVRRGGWPSEAVHDCLIEVGDNFGTRGGACTFGGATAGTYYIALRPHVRDAGTLSVHYQTVMVNAPL
jgi:hypothetical protein